MTRSEAEILSNILPKVHTDIQEVHIRLKMYREGKIVLDDSMVQNCESRLDKCIDTIALINKMALAELC